MHPIVSDVPIFASKEWAWLDGPVELKVSADRSELMIRRTKARLVSAWLEKWSRPSDLQSWINVRRREKEAIGLPEGVATEDQIKSEYCWHYDPVSRDVTMEDCTRWHAEAEHATSCDWPTNLTWLQVDGRPVSVNYAIWDRLNKAPLAAPRFSGFRVEPLGEVCSDAFVGDEVLDERLTAFERCLEREYAQRGTRQGETLVAALSSLPSGGGYMIFGGSGGRLSWRQHYHQVVSLNDMRVIGRSVRIPMVGSLDGQVARPGRDLLAGIGWSADERFVVYVGLTSFCVVHVDFFDNSG